MSDVDVDEDEIQVEDVVDDLSRLLVDLGPEREPTSDGEFQGRFRRIRNAITLLAERTWPDPPPPGLLGS